VVDRAGAVVVQDMGPGWPEGAVKIGLAAPLLFMALCGRAAHLPNCDVGLGPRCILDRSVGPTIHTSLTPNSSTGLSCMWR